MFESDDWDFDQDFLNDADEKATKFYSQAENEEDEPAKRRKVEICDYPIFMSNEFRSTEKTVDKKVTQCNGDKASRKNLVLGMFNESHTNPHDSNVTAVQSYSNSSCKSGNVRLPRKNFVLGILQKGNEQEIIVQNDLCILNNAKNLQRTSAEIQVKGSINSAQQSSLLNYKKADSHTSIANSIPQHKISNASQRMVSRTPEFRRPSTVNLSNESRRQLLVGLLESPTRSNGGPVESITKSCSSSIKVPELQTNKKMTLIRRFPGPAGLLPDDIDICVPPISYLNSLQETENDRPKDTSESNLSKYCSQDTKNLFTEGAWQLMLDDLPNDFLKGYEIATIKRLAKANHRQSTKVQFLAGVLEYVDHSHGDRSIMLKDFTDNIQGIIHRDIPLKYPDLLEPNVVVLLHDVGLLRTSGSLIVNKYQILISPLNLLGIYSNKGKIVRTLQMASILGRASNDKVNCSKNVNLMDRNSNVNDAKDTRNSLKNYSNLDASCDDTSLITNEINFDVENDFSFTVSATKIKNSQNQQSVNSSSEVDKQQSPGESSIVLEESYLGTTDDLQAKRFDIEKISADASNEKSKSLVNMSNRACNDKERTVRSNDNKQNSRLTIKSRLLQFRSNNVSTPAELDSHVISDYEIAPASKGPSNFFETAVCNSENDPDDEMLSQLDVDGIFSNYDKENRICK